MYFPSDPNKIPASWDTFKESLLFSNVSYILENGKNRPENLRRRLTSVDVNDLVGRLKKMNYVRIGVSRLMAVPPHFGVVLDSEGKTADVIEYLALESTSERIERDISLLVDLIFYELPNLRRLSVPLNVGTVVVPGIEAKIEKKINKTEFIRSSKESDESPTLQVPV